ncbi:unnamed protein product [Protopolystoma xenopodis]|uniref:Uncharacterized protein n=1 Tax=Protopolystoma xenopodis TaxID=117903 RepID=A0A448WK13_9PLAT|nr:unnamed protein product [Protopolystoma xenopodis]
MSECYANIDADVDADSLVNVECECDDKCEADSDADGELEGESEGSADADVNDFGDGDVDCHDDANTDGFSIHPTNQIEPCRLPPNLFSAFTHPHTHTAELADNRYGLPLRQVVQHRPNGVCLASSHFAGSRVAQVWTYLCN